ncbi:MAG: iron-sulfur cluster assembly scaffold protein [Sphingomonas sp.]|nr:iron-sulfur cluster assembly scaffold protein [Sphingomonas sp.]
MKPPLYTREILRLAASVPPPAELDPNDARVELRAPTCGSRLRLDIRSEVGAVSELALAVEACAFGQAATALMARHAIGTDLATAGAAEKAIADWLAGRRDDPGEWPGIQALEPARFRPGRHDAILLPFRALVAALKEQG